MPAINLCSGWSIAVRSTTWSGSPGAPRFGYRCSPPLGGRCSRAGAWSIGRSRPVRRSTGSTPASASSPTFGFPPDSSISSRPTSSAATRLAWAVRFPPQWFARSCSSAPTCCCGRPAVSAAELVEALVAMLNAGVLPLVPEQGSVGASGDLAPLSHIGLALMGEGQVITAAGVAPAAEALRGRRSHRRTGLRRRKVWRSSTAPRRRPRCSR